MNTKDQTNNISSVELWPLFGNDKHQARRCIQRLIKEKPTHELLHLAISTGNADLIDKLAPNFYLSRSTRATLAYRTNLKEGNFSQAFGIITPEDIKEYAKEVIRKNTLGRTPIPIQAKDTIGIGDHLESYCFIKNWQYRDNLQFHVYTGTKKYSQLHRFLAKTNSFPLSVSKEKFLTLNSFKYLLYQEPANYFCRSLTSLKQSQGNSLLCCWQAEGSGEPFSKHSRSVPFHLVNKFYRSLLKSNPTIAITDITSWKPWQENSLAKLGIKLYNPGQSDVFSLAEVASQHCRIISIDTALTHLCAVTDLKAHLLLNLHPDERWSYLLQPGTCYSRNLTIHRQSAFGEWTKMMEQLTRQIVLTYS